VTPAQVSFNRLSLGAFIMGMSISTNMASMNSQRYASRTQDALSTSMERLSSGLRVNNSRDDAAGLAIADRMNAQVKGMNVAIRNSNDGISMAQTAEGALATATDILQRMRELATQSKNATNGTSDRANLDSEFQALGSEITRISTQTKFNGQSVISGAGAKAYSFQVGADSAQTVDVTTTDLAAGTEVAKVIAGDITDATKAGTAMDDIDAALDEVTTSRASLGASINRFQFTIANLQTSVENQTAARGRIMDTDYAKETANLSRSQVLQQAATAMIAQANQAPNQVMSLLR
jgi:flagellin